MNLTLLIYYWYPWNMRASTKKGKRNKQITTIDEVDDELAETNEKTKKTMRKIYCMRMTKVIVQSKTLDSSFTTCLPFFTLLGFLNGMWYLYYISLHSLLHPYIKYGCMCIILGWFIEIHKWYSYYTTYKLLFFILYEFFWFDIHVPIMKWLILAYASKLYQLTRIRTKISPSQITSLQLY